MILYIVIWKSHINANDRPLRMIAMLLRLKSCYKPKANQTEMKADIGKI